MSYGGAIARPTLRGSRLNAILSRGLLGAICAVPGGAAADAIAGRTASPTPTPAFANHAALLADAEAREPSQDQHTRANRAPEAEVVTRTIGSLTLHIPKGYLDPTIAYPGYVQIHALLPCLLPEMPENSIEFHKLSYGRVLTADLSLWTPDNLIGKQLLEAHLRMSQFAREHSPKLSRAKIYIGAVPNSNFVLYKDYLLEFDIFVKTSSVIPFVDMCNWTLGYCEVRDKLWRTILIDYRYSRNWVTPNITESVAIDRRVHQLADSFLDKTTKKAPGTTEGRCK